MSRLTRQTLTSVTLVAAVALLLSLASSSCNGEDSLDCNEAVCARVVTKCLLTEHCKCNFAAGNYTCHKDCFGCLAELCYDCCSCFGMCPKTTSNPLSKISSIEQFDEPIPQLFEIYTSDGGDDRVPPRYTSHTFEQTRTLGKDQVLMSNCTVAYTTKCTANDECKTTCKNMGASFSRWFHDGCCECVGNTCVDYGLSEARCSNCPPIQKDEDVDVDDFYYGEDDDDGFFDEVDDEHNIWTTNITGLDEEMKANGWRDPGNRSWEG